MIQLDVGGRRYSVAAGEMTIGSDDGASIPVFGQRVSGRHAVIQGWPDGSAAVRAVDGSEVLVNGIQLGAEPTPLLHGDKLVIGRQEILVVDESRSGSTRIAPAIQMPAAPEDGARVVCLTDGREYPIGAGPLVFGREAGADVVAPGDDVSRRHAELHRDSAGFLLLDASVNGTLLNGERVVGERRLKSGDVIRIGSEEFRFHAGKAPPAGAHQRLSDTMFGVAAFRPTPVPEPGPAPLVSVLFRSGPRKGDRLTLSVPMINVGRADYNDLVLADPSVSTMHAKIQRRGGVWILADLGSTNGTFMEGEPVTSEVALAPGATLRFGEVSVLFEPLDDGAPEEQDGTRAMPRVEVASPVAAAPAPVPEASVRRPIVRRPPPTPEPRRRGSWLTLAVLVAVAAGLAAYLLLSR
ncbi:MAG TPA: FHA domain-containing protein [Gemmatimonadales bacterium]|jgi:pSer/pThr/pTyr-binding forkhead associated (FHA) protein|nr:FHA domain-containing protein [Gemmatimonadales bacterium]